MMFDMFKKYLFCFVVILMSSFAIFAQDTDRKQVFDESKWEELSREMDFPIEQKPEAAEKSNDSSDSSDTDLSFLKYVFLIIVVLALVYVIYLIAKNSEPANKAFKGDSFYDLSRLEEDLHDTDLNALLTKALEQAMFNLAIRIHFLIIIKNLSQKEQIIWEVDKTNRAYLNEMKSHPDYKVFYKLTRLYEKIWFGDEALSQSIYTGIAPVYTKFNQRIAGDEKR